MSLILKGKHSLVNAGFSNIASDPKFAFLASYEEIEDYSIVNGKISVNNKTEKVSKSKPADTKTQENGQNLKKRRKGKVTPEKAPAKLEKVVGKSRKAQAKSKKTPAESENATETEEFSEPVAKKKKIKKNNRSKTKKINASKIDAELKTEAESKIEDPSEDLNIDLESETEEIATDETQPISDMTYLEGMESWQTLYVPLDVQRAMLDLDFTTPTPIQSLVLPSAIRDKLDILGAAETGSGKTLAFGIPILAGLIANQHRERNGNPEALIITPTRELAIQIKDHLKAITKYVDIHICCIIGGMSIQKQERIIKQKPHIIVGTPGRLWQLSQESSSLDFSDLKYLAIDETDRMVEQGHFEELTLLLAHIHSCSNESITRQTMVFSATLTYVHPAPKRAGRNMKKDMTPKQKLDNIVETTGLRKKRKIFDITRKFATAESLTECRINCENLQQKDSYMYYFLASYPGRTLIFCNSIDCCRRLHGILTILKLNPQLLHAKMQQRQRLKNLERFTASKQGILLATDVAARGLDIRGVQHVIHYQVPRTAEVYVHRSGRTARANCEGVSVMLVDSNEAHLYARICRNLNREEDLTVFPTDNRTLLSQVKLRLKLAVTIESSEHKEKKHKAKANWFLRAAEAAEMEIDDKLLEQEATEEEVGDSSGQIKQARAQLDALLRRSMHVNTTGVNVKPTRYPTSEIVQLHCSQNLTALAQAKKSDAKKKKKFRRNVNKIVV